MTDTPQVGIIMGSQSDWPTMKEAATLLEELGISYETKIVSAHRTPDRLWAYGKEAAGRGLQVIIAGAGGAAHLPGMMASKTRVPVIGVPVQTRALSGVDSLYSIVQMPKGFPVATMAIGAAGAANAGLMAAGILALQDADLATRLDAWRDALPPFRMNHKMTSPLAPGSTIGILGGGQLGRMLSVAAARLGYKTCIYEPGGDCPASHVANHHFQKDYDDVEALRAFADAVDVITYEFENIPTSALDILEEHRPIHPNREALRVSQDRLTEKTFLQDLGLKTAPFANVTDAASMAQAVADIGAPSILKTRRFGYDGKGQARLKTPEDAAAALADMAGAPALLEGFVDFSHEVSVIAARGIDGEVACFDPGENVHKDGILATTTVPARLTAGQRMDAVLLAANILNKLNYVGVMGVELFVTNAGLIVNEVAPRVHNSGHWTQNGCTVDQFEQHIRAVAGLPLGDGQRQNDVVMENLIGDDMDRLPDLLKERDTAVHLYGKTETKPGRKMGHVNRITRAD